MTIASHSRTRRGAITTAWLVFFCLVLIVMIWAVEALSFRSNARAELQNAVDAAGHAATRRLVTESVFAQGYTPGTSVVPIDRAALIAAARADGERLARLNRVMGQSLTLADNADNDTDGELYAGTLDNPTSRTFVGLTNTGFDPYNPDLNAVRVKKHFSRVGASSTYFIDRDVIGFRLKPPPAASPNFPAIPMVPIAILSDPCPPGRNTPDCWAQKGQSTWERAIMARAGRDDWSMGPSGQPVHGVGDGIPEIAVTLTEGGADNDNGRLIYFDPQGTVAALAAQVKNSIVYGDLPAVNGQRAGQFLLNDGTQAQNVAAAATGALPAGGAKALLGDAQKGTGLLGILGRPRVWVLYSGVPSRGNNPTVNVIGFVVACVMSVTAGAGNSGPLTITLQPSVLVTDKAVTAWTLRDAGPRSLYNPYLARLRFVE
jgi:hypothetical protein